MNGWAENLQNAVDFIEENITEELTAEEIAAKAYVSPFYFRKIFGALCGLTLGEYIRLRRLSLAGQELSAGGIKVIDAAVKYGYDSPDSFARAFAKFHGITPSAAKEKGARLRSFAPIHIKISLEGGSMLDYKIVEKAQFTVVGKSRKFSAETSYGEIPKFWDENNALGENRAILGMYGVCMDGDGKNFDYLIADNYIPWLEVPEGCVTKVIPAGTWAVFPCKGALPKALQELNTKIWSEWLPSCRDYELAGNYNIELYSEPVSDPNEYYSEIWVPVKKKS